MKVLHLATSDLNGGAARAAYRIHAGLLAKGVDSVMLVGRKESIDSTVVAPFTEIEKVRAKLAFKFDRYPLKFFRSAHATYHSLNWMNACPIRRINEIQPSIINLQWIGDGFIRIENLAKLKVPLVWRLADMWPFAGAEHYVGDSRRYVEGYSPENRPMNERGLDLNRWVWRRKVKAFHNISNLTIVSPSKWLADCARESMLFRNRRIEVIPTGNDLEVFRPIEKKCARKELGISENRPVIAFGAFGATHDPRKGGAYLSEALKIIRSRKRVPDFEVVVFGNSNASNDDNNDMKITYFGKIDDNRKLAQIYSAADVFVAPSTEENLPNTVIEAMACGTPCVGFDVGGMPDIIFSGKNGYLATPFSSDDLAHGIEWTISEGIQGTRLSQSARDTVEKNHSVELQAERYVSLYKDILSK